MIALVIGLLATGAMLKVYVDSSRLYRFNESLARIQENGRFGLEFIRRDARMAGFWGCNSAVDPFIQLTPGTTLPDFLLNGWVTGINDGGSNESDSITFASAASGSLVTDDEIDSASSASLLVPTDSTWAAADVLIITDCVTADIFEFGSDTELSNAYAAGSRIYRVQRIKYFIALGADPEQHSLRRLTCPALGDCTGEGDELVEGIENMQILMGEDTNADFDGSVNRYVHPGYGDSESGDFVGDRVVSTRISLLAVSPYNNVTTERAPYFFNGAWVGTDDISTDDRYLRKDFTTTVALRNKNRIRTEAVATPPLPTGSDYAGTVAAMCALGGNGKVDDTATHGGDDRLPWATFETLSGMNQGDRLAALRSWDAGRADAASLLYDNITELGVATACWSDARCKATKVGSTSTCDGWVVGCNTATSLTDNAEDAIDNGWPTHDVPGDTTFYIAGGQPFGNGMTQEDQDSNAYTSADVDGMCSAEGDVDTYSCGSKICQWQDGIQCKEKTGGGSGSGSSQKWQVDWVQFGQGKPKFGGIGMRCCSRGDEADSYEHTFDTNGDRWAVGCGVGRK